MFSNHRDGVEGEGNAIARQSGTHREAVPALGTSGGGESTQDREEDRRLSAYDYHLPEEKIAQNPAVPRDSSRLLVVSSPNSHHHQRFRDLPAWLKPGDLLVLNNTRVMPARLYGHKSTGAPVEVLLLEPQPDNTWLALVKPGRRLKPGSQILFAPSDRLTEGAQFPQENLLKAKVLATHEATGGRFLQFEVPSGADLMDLLPAYGQVPFPPYVTASQASPEQYQTVYAEKTGSAAAPTAGLHFTDELFKRLAEKGIQCSFVTLHVGVGTFRPVEVEDVTHHVMHEEWVQVPQETVEKIRQTKANGGRTIAVGTTVVRSLEGAGAATGKLEAFCGKTDLFIYPGYQWRVVDGLITNFHLPRSSLLMLVSALVGRTRLLDLYREAIAHNYRFYSFGDAMLILPRIGVKPPDLSVGI
ncbi:tRNA preQ1(34) S-adenosylmethionine ribosyltransferase-isomerase QueA [Phormidium sp. CCY1219]|uniref:tRNA preQ1(34) S-adenosylmethionine ribosyltransferase-isomerase QueA n=1 Tax=Phormidium sp. CCY1219 TaxID=2886104 RepID=UPI002D1EEA06|nr:tRNA preQ1(34) S-adenosylmethionine ribosyltransferase-isomerase QueA [Phormidium sp. CCY1219]MEB3830271.1 tRNA preQ1(34) S-adenosylmethionine ribosyltransferase-isomerase QueA [Phormidium sp. CCY1219]